MVHSNLKVYTATFDIFDFIVIYYCLQIKKQMCYGKCKINHKNKIIILKLDTHIILPRNK